MLADEPVHRIFDGDGSVEIAEDEYPRFMQGRAPMISGRNSQTALQRVVRRGRSGDVEDLVFTLTVRSFHLHDVIDFLAD